jgi:SAM-dependent methyltransferase
VLVQRSPEARFTAVDLSGESLAQARAAVARAGAGHVEFVRADIFDLPFDPGSFDHVFVCFVLEHLSEPVQALLALRRMLRPGGTLTLIEGDHGSVFFHPESAAARAAIACQVELQRRAGGSAFIGRALGPLLRAAGFDDARVEPRMVYVDANRPDWARGFTRDTFAAMIEGVADRAVETGLVERSAFDEGVRALHRAAEGDGVFCYTFFKAVASSA